MYQSVNPILSADSYKSSHFKQYPPGTTEVSSYIEARGNGPVLFFGLQAYLKSIRPVTHTDVDEAVELFAAHGVPFNEQGWRDIVRKLGGKLPLEIQALAEGRVVPHSIPLVQVRNTLPEFFWLTSYVETALLRAVWYPTTVATASFKAKGEILSALKVSADEPLKEIPFKLHDFGARGVSSGESAALGGLAHLVNFMGTDTVEALVAARRFYGENMAGFSIPAAEHSTITSWGREGEADAYRNMLTAFDTPLVAVVSDSYDIFSACNDLWGGLLKGRVEKLESSGRTLVIRPDSGDPRETVLRVLEILFDRFGYTRNTKGYKVLPPYLRIIQGDGVNLDSIKGILAEMLASGYSASNIAFGMGGALLQKCDRDTHKFAMKACEAVVYGARRDVFKDPVTDSGKVSKKGRQAVVMHDGALVSVREDSLRTTQHNYLIPVWRDGNLLVDWKLSEVRNNTSLTMLGA